MLKQSCKPFASTPSSANERERYLVDVGTQGGDRTTVVTDPERAREVLAEARMLWALGLVSGGVGAAALAAGAGLVGWDLASE